MVKKLSRIIIGVILVAGIVFLWRDFPSQIQFVESLIRPVFQKQAINDYAGIYKEDPLLVMALIKVESNFYWRARSPRGAIGLMQIMPNTGKEIASELKINPFHPDDLEDPKLNIRFGFHYLSKLRKELGEDDPTVLAAYNAGIQNVKRWKGENKYLKLEDIEFPETKKFVQDVLKTHHWLKKIQKLRHQVVSQRKI
jgi:soluble lytic murein transglycosylase